MKDYQITLTVKNNLLLSAMRNNGFQTAAELSRFTGVAHSTIGLYLNLKTPALKRHGNDFKDSVMIISRALKTLPEDLFPVQHLRKKLDKNKVAMEMSLPDVENLLTHDFNPENLIEIKERKKCIHLTLNTLNDRDKEVLEYRFGINRDEKTLQECGEIFGISKERIRQIEARGIRKLRNPKRSDKLKIFIQK